MAALVLKLSQFAHRAIQFAADRRLVEPKPHGRAAIRKMVARESGIEVREIFLAAAFGFVLNDGALNAPVGIDQLE